MRTKCLCTLFVFLTVAGSSGADIRGVADLTGMLQTSFPDTANRIAWMYGALFIDFAWIAVKMYAAWNDKSVGIGCEFLFALLWYPLTIHALGWAFPGTTITQGIDLATQQITSIGYGSANVRGNDQKLFHGVNGLASQLGPAGIAGFLLDKYIGWVYATMFRQRQAAAAAAKKKMVSFGTWGPDFLIRYCPDAAEEIHEFGSSVEKCKKFAGKSWFKNIGHDHVVYRYIQNKLQSEYDGFWKKIILGTVLLAFGALAYAMLQNNGGSVGGFQALYAVLISATTIGYGDYSPNQEWEKQLSGFVLPFLTAAFAQFFGGTFADTPKEDLFEWLKTEKGGSYEFTPDKDCGFPIDELADAFIKKTQLQYDSELLGYTPKTASDNATLYKWFEQNISKGNEFHEQRVKLAAHLKEKQKNLSTLIHNNFLAEQKLQADRSIAVAASKQTMYEERKKAKRLKAAEKVAQQRDAIARDLLAKIQAKIAAQKKKDEAQEKKDAM